MKEGLVLLRSLDIVRAPCAVEAVGAMMKSCTVLNYWKKCHSKKGN
jgi:hypothetical protein